MINPNYPDLKFNPFVTPTEQFFGGGERQAQLNQLRQLTQWSRRLLVVTGEHGMGKTTLFKTFNRDPGPGVRPARINGTLVSSANDVMQEICIRFGIVTPDHADSDLLAALIRDYASTSDKPCIVLIDDAHLIEGRGVDAVVALLDDESALHMILFAEELILSVLEKSASRRNGLSWHHMPLISLGIPEIREYLQFRFALAGHKGRLPFSERQIQRICSRSGGNVGRLNELANKELIELEREQGRFPALHRSLALTLGVVVIAAYLLWDTFEEEDVTSGGEAGAAVGSPVEPTVDVERELEDAANTTGALEGEQQGEGQEEAQEVAVEEVAASDSGGTQDPAPSPEKVAEAEEAEKQVDKVVEVAEARPPPVPPPSVSIETPDEPTVAAAPASDLRPMSTSHGANDADWIRAQPGENYTLQLLGSSSLPNLKAFMDRQSDPEQFGVFESTRSGRPFYVVVYGSFSSRPAAQAVATSLPASVGKVEPWVRRFDNLWKSIP